MSKVKKTMSNAAQKPAPVESTELPIQESVVNQGQENMEGVKDVSKENTEATTPTEETTSEAASEGNAESTEPESTGDQETQVTEVTPVQTIELDQPQVAAIQVTKSKVTLDHVSENQAYLTDAAENGIQAQKIIIASLNNFCDRFLPRVPLNPEQAVRWHKEFYQDLLYILSLDFEEFKKAWATILIYFAEHHGDNPTQKNYTALSEYSTSRYTDQWHREGDHKTISTYTNLIQLIRRTRSKALRQAMPGTIQLDKVGPQALTEKQVQNLKDFYNA